MKWQQDEDCHQNVERWSVFGFSSARWSMDPVGKVALAVGSIYRHWKRMAFLTQAFDDTDENALARRMAAREAHLESARKLKSDGRLIHAGAILDESGNMIGSMLLFDVESQQEVEALMKGDPYTEKGVWVRWTITPVRLAPL